MFQICTCPGCPRAGVFGTPGCCWEHCEELASKRKECDMARDRVSKLQKLLPRFKNASKTDKEVAALAGEIQKTVDGPIEEIESMVREYPVELRILMASRAKRAEEELAKAQKEFEESRDGLQQLQDTANVAADKHVLRFVKQVATDMLYVPGGTMYRRALESFSRLSGPN